MLNEKLDRLIRSKGSQYITKNTQALSPYIRQVPLLNNQSHNYSPNYSIQRIQAQSTHSAIAPQTDRNNTQFIAKIQPVCQPQSVSPVRVIQLSTDRTQQPHELNEVQYHEKPLQVVSAQDIENRYKQKLLLLEQLINRLQNENQRLKMNEQNLKSMEYMNKIKELEVMVKNFEDQEDKLNNEIQQLKKELFQSKEVFTSLQKQIQNKNNNNEDIRKLKKQMQQYEIDNKEMQNQISKKDTDILKLRSVLNEKENWIDQLNNQIKELQTVEENYSRVETTVISLQGEIDVWRRKFKEKNEEASELSEKLIMAEASLEALKKKQITQVKEINITKSNSKTNNNIIQSVDTTNRLNRGSHYSQRQQL
ncbi:unnamed protein product (macronuclear) [Paramecium tetraurelia]|uniref:Uncharacterized protein n=1 Tax=Paramecium tetraurelia TaxID=5888 RepID=A0CQE4_PARTE|nr:uncharacterized protein GSPATT00009359001 [Paramecium tetraurelia]CAK73011.1 unnamed protein product [Paramecium tetraurelia]|eukprot:XP_001440408.1 hypothetical protein (macronuclear) [Paramecium tetraurelia strain d4-2]